MLKHIGFYFSSLIAFLLIDFVWLAFISPSLYKSQIGHLMASNVKYIPALAFYLLFVFAILILAIYPGLYENNLMKAIYLGALVGLVSYGTYDLTNYATLRDWPLKIVIIDLIWGTFLSSSTATISFLIGKHLFKLT
jgi:uncharacterized membrane protein